jgi:site-specific DNA recombinase
MRYFIYCRKSTEAEDRQVLSIGSQEAEIRKAFGQSVDVEIVDVIHESQSAKEPGRPMFNEMLARIEKGEAQGIAAWDPDRLARNSVDGGRVIYLLDRRRLADLKFVTLSFENTPTGKFMLSIMFGQSKYYVDNLSENVKRGNRAKLALGWRPNHPPIGYLNDPSTKTIIPDPERFALVRRVFELALTGTYSIRRLTDEARALGLKTRRRKRRGDRYLSSSNIHWMLTNPFYAGIIRWAGQSYPGAHIPIVNNEEFARVNRWLSRKLDKLPSGRKKVFPFKGLITCGECGLSITAEDKTNRYGYKYTYYHCTWKSRDYKCRQRSISGRALNEAFTSFLEMHTVPAPLHAWLLRRIQRLMDYRAGALPSQDRALKKAHGETEQQLKALTSLRIRDLVSDEEFASHRSAILQERMELEDRRRNLAKMAEWFEPAKSVVSFNDRALFWYALGDTEAKWKIAYAMSSNLVLFDKKVSIQAKEPFTMFRKTATRPMLQAALDRIRTLYQANDAGFLRVLSVIRELEEDFGNRGADQPSSESLPPTISKVPKSPRHQAP